MTLEDFFTLTEMKDGLATLARVEELVLVMEKQKDSVGGNASDAARQWSTVARTLAITGSDNCLDHFIQLKGLCFLNQWLLEAQKRTSDIGDNVVDELVNALLASLERLPVDRDNSSAFGIGTTVEQLLEHKNLEIRERARSLIDKLNSMKVDEAKGQNLEKDGKCINDQLESTTSDTKTTDSGLLAEPPVLEDSLCKEITNDRCQVTPAPTESHTLDDTKSSDNLLVDNIKNVIPKAYSNMADVNAVLGDAKLSDNSLLPKSSQDDLFSAKESSGCPSVGLPSTSPCNSPNCKTRVANDEHYTSDIQNGADCSKEAGTKESNFCRSDQEEISNILPSVHSSVITAQKAEIDPPLCCNDDSTRNNGSPKSGMTAMPQLKIESSNSKKPEHLKTAKERKRAEGFHNISSKGILIKKDAPDASSHRRGGVRSVVQGINNESNVRVSKRTGHAFPSSSSKSVGAGDMGDDGKRSELGLDCEIDALELARQVAIEVEREVVDYREPFCSSPDVNSREIMDASSPDVGEEKQDQPESNSGEITDTVESTQDSETGILDKPVDPADDDFVEGNHDQPMVDDLKLGGSPIERESSDSNHSSKENNMRTSQKVIDLEENKQEKSSSVAQELNGKSDKNICDFDLNEDASTEDLDCLADVVPSLPANLSAPIAVVAASKGAPGLPVAPLHFGGELGWRGSAATSAFRPASSRKTPDSEKAYSSPKQKSNILEIDLNVADDEDDVAVNHVSTKQVPVSSGLPSGGSSIEVSSRRAEKFKLDLNSLGDEDAPSYLSNWKLHQNCSQSLSPASSSSSRQPSMRDFDLNDKPAIFEGHGSHSLHKSTSRAFSTHESSKLDEPVIMIMGSRVPMEKQGYDNNIRQSFSGSGLSLERTMATGASLPFTHMPSPAYGYPRLPNGPVFPINPAFYGPGSHSHMVDFKGATVIPQLYNSSSGPNGVPPPPVRPPFLMSATGGVPSSSNGVWSSQPGLDLNSSMSLMENGRWEGGSLKQAYNTQGTLKRKEPDCGWEPYGLTYKQVTPWQ